MSAPINRRQFLTSATFALGITTAACYDITLPGDDEESGTGSLLSPSSVFFKWSFDLPLDASKLGFSSLASYNGDIDNRIANYPTFGVADVQGNVVLNASDTRTNMGVGSAMQESYVEIWLPGLRTAPSSGNLAVRLEDLTVFAKANGRTDYVTIVNDPKQPAILHYEIDKKSQIGSPALPLWLLKGTMNALGSTLDGNQKPMSGLTSVTLNFAVLLPQ